MDGGERGPPLLEDPAIERWAAMRANTHLYFRFSPWRHLLPALFFLAAVPYGVWRLTIAGFVATARLTA
jgi:hypothetical protein